MIDVIGMVVGPWRGNDCFIDSPSSGGWGKVEHHIHDLRDSTRLFFTISSA
jgi:hypothetical protein